MGDLKKENGKPLMGLLLVTVAPIYLSVAFLHWEWLVATASGWTLEAWGQRCHIDSMITGEQKVTAATRQRVPPAKMDEPLLPGCPDKAGHQRK